MSFAKDRLQKKGKAGQPSGKLAQSTWGTTGRSGDGTKCSHVPDLGDTIDCVVDAGAALIFSRTSDGGAIALTLLDGDTRRKVYCADQAALNEAFDELTRLYAAAADGG